LKLPTEFKLAVNAFRMRVISSINRSFVITSSHPLLAAVAGGGVSVVGGGVDALIPLEFICGVDVAAILFVAGGGDVFSAATVSGRS